MTATRRNDQSGAAPYATPRLRRFGSVTELTQQRTMNGQMDGGANNTRSQ